MKLTVISPIFTDRLHVPGEIIEGEAPIPFVLEEVKEEKKEIKTEVKKEEPKPKKTSKAKAR